MQNYILRRLLLALPTLWLVSLIVFSLIRLVPGDTLMANLAESGNIPKENLDAARRQLGLDKPVHRQYVDWIWGLVRLKPGNSFMSGRPAEEALFKSLPVSIELALLSLLVAALIGLPLGALSALLLDRPLDHVIRLLSVMGLALPNFWVALVVVILFSRFLGWLPPTQYRDPWRDPWTNFTQIMLPTLILGVNISATVMRMTRSTMLEVLRQDYIRTAWSKGLRQRTIVVRHALRNALIPVLTILGTTLSFLIGGSVLIESIFSLPGVGSLTLTAIQRRDYVQIQLNVLFLALVLIVMNLVVDLLYGFLDPRLQSG
ncbi:MAG: ABC transporter permease [Dehalococcoidia bacterium]